MKVISIQVGKLRKVTWRRVTITTGIFKERPFMTRSIKAITGLVLTGFLVGI